MERLRKEGSILCSQIPKEESPAVSFPGPGLSYCGLPCRPNSWLLKNPGIFPGPPASLWPRDKPVFWLSCLWDHQTVTVSSGNPASSLSFHPRSQHCSLSTHPSLPAYHILSWRSLTCLRAAQG